MTFYAQLLFKTATILVLILKRSWKMNDIDTLKTSGWGGAANAFCNGRVKWRNFQLVLWNIILEWDLVADGMSLACVIYSTAAPTNEVTKPWPNNGTHHLDELAWKTSRQHHPRHRIILIPCHLFHFIVIWFFFSLSLFLLRHWLTGKKPEMEIRTFIIPTTHLVVCKWGELFAYSVSTVIAKWNVCSPNATHKETPVEIS